MVVDFVLAVGIHGRDSALRAADDPGNQLGVDSVILNAVSLDRTLVDANVLVGTDLAPGRHHGRLLRADGTHHTRASGSDPLKRVSHPLTGPRARGPTARSNQLMQNSLPSGSAMVTHAWGP